MEKITRKGQCLCGDIVFTATGDPLWISHCHCRSCRRNTGSVAATFTGYRPDQVLFKPDNRRFFSSSEGVSRGFCGRCGTPVSYTSTRWPDELHLYLGLFDQPDSLVPNEHVHFAEKISWLELDTALPFHLHSSG